MNKRTLIFIAACISVLGCTSCAAETVESENMQANNSETADTINSITESADADISDEEEAIQQDNTYTTKLTEANGVLVPVFSFDYSDNWKISHENIGDEFESVEVVNENGALIRFTYMASSFSYGDPRYEVEVDISRIADSCFVPGYAQINDYSNLGSFAVVEVESDSQIYFAVKPESECGITSIGGNFMTGFWYDGLLEFMAEIPKEITESDKQEIIDILSSFRVSDNININPTYAALRNGDFSEFAGTYKAAGVYEEMYGGGEPISDLILDQNGIVTEGGTWFEPELYPKTAPKLVTKNEDGSYKCQVRYESEHDQDYFLIYPKGVIGENPYIYNDPFLTEHVYIQYMSIDGSVMDIIYYEVED